MKVSLEEQVVAAGEREPDPAFAELDDAVLVEGFAREASVIAASTCRWLLMLAEIIRRGAWADDGAASPAAWLSWKVGMAASTAREHVRVALALADWPLVTAEFAAGRMSYSKVRAIVSTHRPELDRLLVDTWAARDLSMRELAGGMSEIRITLPTEDALARFQTLDRRAEEAWREQHAAAKAAAGADEPGGCGDAAASPGDAAASLAKPDPVGCRRADAFLEAVDGAATADLHRCPSRRPRP